MSRVDPDPISKRESQPPERGQYLGQLPDGGHRVSCGRDDTVESLYRLAYGRQAITGGQIQFASWLFAKHGGLPEPGTQLEVPTHECMLQTAAKTAKATTAAALKCLQDGVSCGDLRKGGS